MVPKVNTESQTHNTQEDKELKLGRSRSESQGNTILSMEDQNSTNTLRQVLSKMIMGEAQREHDEWYALQHCGFKD